jgi:hypothetical protein
MDRAEELVRRGGVTLSFDTSAIVVPTDGGAVGFGGFLTICDLANELRVSDPPCELTLVVPSLAHMEVLHDLRTAQAGRFDPDMVARGLQRKKVEVRHFDGQDALAASKVLHGWCPTGEDWRNAKRGRCLEALGLPGVRAEGHGVASIDWAIAAQAEAHGWVLVTGDQRAEFSKVSLRLRKSDLHSLLEDLRRERGLS